MLVWNRASSWKFSLQRQLGQVFTLITSITDLCNSKLLSIIEVSKVTCERNSVFRIGFSVYAKKHLLINMWEMLCSCYIVFNGLWNKVTDLIRAKIWSSFWMRLPKGFSNAKNSRSYCVSDFRSSRDFYLRGPRTSLTRMTKTLKKSTWWSTTNPSGDQVELLLGIIPTEKEPPSQTATTTRGDLKYSSAPQAEIPSNLLCTMAARVRSPQPAFTFLLSIKAVQTRFFSLLSDKWLNQLIMGKWREGNLNLWCFVQKLNNAAVKWIIIISYVIEDLLRY